MDIITIDFETYWDVDYTLSKMTTDGYVHDPRFKAHGMGVRWPNGMRQYYLPNEIDSMLAMVDWSKTAVLCHNTAFDGYILAIKYGVKPALWLDTLSMARALFGVEIGVSLAKVAQYYGLPPKGDEVMNTKGKRVLTFEEQQKLAAYCLNDVDLTWEAFRHMIVGYPKLELQLIDLTIRMFTEPKLVLNEPALQAFLAQIQAKKQSLLDRVGMANRDELMSNEKFAAVLEGMGVEVPLKWSEKKEDWVPAFAKTDPGFKELLSDDQPEEVRWLVEARLETKSTGDETRTQRFLSVTKDKRPWPVLLNYCGASTTDRWSGGNKQNPQNLRRGGLLRESIEAPDGYLVVVADSSQIEARKTALVAGQEDLIDQFAQGQDVYSSFASSVYGYEINKYDHPDERFVGKTSILGLGYGMGHLKLNNTLKMQSEGRVDLGEAESKRVVDIYRRKFDRIPALWRMMDKVLVQINGGVECEYEYFSVTQGGILLPNGLKLRYPNLERNESTGEWWYTQKKKPTKIYGGKLTENLIQALARIVVAEQMVKIMHKKLAAALGHHLVLMTHDEIVCVCPEKTADKLLQVMLRIMGTPPSWAPTLPVAAEGGVGKRYSDAK